ncbi:MAG: fatty acid transporter [Zoogloea sp.]|nr:fatty acid transporter [Zoogloea sp.]
MNKNSALRAIPAALLGLGSSLAGAAGFQLLEQNASGLGNAYAGSAAVAENASTIFFNPAGMSFLPGTSASVGITAVHPSFQFSDNGNSRNPGALGGTPPTGGNGGDAGSVGAVPNIYIARQIDRDWHVGLGISAPFGLRTEYSANWAGQFLSDKFDIKTINFNPSVAYRVNERLSAGFGFNWQQIDAEYVKQAVIPGGSSLATVKLDGDAVGWNAGIMFQATPDTRFGVSYRSRLRQHTSGSTNIAGVGGFAARADVDLPDTFIASVQHKLNDSWELLGDISRTGWSSIPALVIQSTGLPTDTLKLEFRNTWRVAAGANYKLDDAWKLRFGLAYDQSPVHDPQYRPTSLPDNDRTWLSIGTQYKATRDSVIDVGYTYLYVRDSGINNNGENPLTRGLVSGTYTASGHILGAQWSTRF